MSLSSPLFIYPERDSLQVLVEPSNSLNESLLLSPLLNLNVQVAPDGEAVRHTAEQVDLPGVAGLDEGVLGLVAELGGEDGVGFCGCGAGYVSDMAL